MLQLVSIIGIFLFVLIILIRRLWKTFHPLFLSRNLNPIYPVLFLLSISWVFSHFWRCICLYLLCDCAMDRVG